MLGVFRVGASQQPPTRGPQGIWPRCSKERACTGPSIPCHRAPRAGMPLSLGKSPQLVAGQHSFRIPLVFICRGVASPSVNSTTAERASPKCTPNEVGPSGQTAHSRRGCLLQGLWAAGPGSLALRACPSFLGSHWTGAGKAGDATGRIWTLR